MLTFDQLRIEIDDFILTANMSVPKGTRAAVMGPSGAGKSTLLSAVAGFLKPASGRILWDGADITCDAPGDRPLSLLFQDNNLFPHLTAAQNIGLGLRADLKLNADERLKVDFSLQRVGLGGLGERKPGNLSGGQQSRIALARMLLRGRPLVLLDEPFAALGPALKAEMLDLVAELVAETDATLLMVTHDPSDALRISDHVVMVNEGVVHGAQETHSLFANPPDALRTYLGI